MSGQERRQHRRYSLQMGVQLLRGRQEMEAMVVNASVGGCLLLSPVPLETGEKLTVKMPQLHLPSARLHVLRRHQTQTDTGTEWLVAACFEAALADEAALAKLSHQFQLAAPEEDSRVLH